MTKNELKKAIAEKINAKVAMQEDQRAEIIDGVWELVERSLDEEYAERLRLQGRINELEDQWLEEPAQPNRPSRDAEGQLYENTREREPVVSNISAQPRTTNGE